MTVTKTDKAQIDKFREAAHKVETDEREGAFGRIMKKIAKPLPPNPKDDRWSNSNG